MKHLTNDLLDRMARRELTPDELLETMRHLERCDACARLARERTAPDLAAVRREFAPAAAPPPRAWRFAWRTAAAIAIAIAAAVFFTRDDAPRPAATNTSDPPPPIVTTTTTTTTDPQPAPEYAEPEWQRLVADARSSGALPFPRDLDELRGRDDVLRGQTDASQRVSPAGVVIDSTRPVFRWPARDGARYAVFVFDGERELARSPELQVTRWTPPRELPRGRTLTWQVEAARGDRVETIPRPPAPPARFRIIAERDQRDLARAREAHPQDHLLHAVLYARAGMRDEALAALRRAEAR